MKIKTTIKPNVFMYKSRWCAELENGQYVLSNGSFELMICEKVAEGMKVIENGIVCGCMIKDEESFIWNVENCIK